MIKELEERLTTSNIDLHFNKFCNDTIRENKERLLRTGYISLQYDYMKQTGDTLPDDVAKGIVKQFWTDYKEAGYIDFLNRII